MTQRLVGATRLENDRLLQIKNNSVYRDESSSYGFSNFRHSLYTSHLNVVLECRTSRNRSQKFCTVCLGGYYVTGDLLGSQGSNPYHVARSGGVASELAPNLVANLWLRLSVNNLIR